MVDMVFYLFDVVHTEDRDCLLEAKASESTRVYPYTQRVDSDLVARIEGALRTSWG